MPWLIHGNMHRCKEKGNGLACHPNINDSMKKIEGIRNFPIGCLL
jgi:hypothetical protein